MFGRKNKRERLRIEAFDGSGTKVLDCEAAEYSLPEPILLKLSIEYFGDSQPCEIHRAAVLKRTIMELIDVCGINHETAVTSLPKTLRRCFPAEIHDLRIRKDEI